MSIPSYLGYGYRSFLERTSEKLFGERVFDLPDDVPSGGSTAEIGFGVVATEEDFQSAFSVDAEVSGGYGKLSGHANFALRQQFSRQVTTVTVALTKRIVKGTYRIDISKLRLDKTAADTASGNPADYVRVYGDQVIEGVGVGGGCCYFFQYFFVSESEASQFKASIGARYGVYSGDVSVAQTSLLKKGALRVSLSGYSTGTVDVPHIIRENTKWDDGPRYIFSKDFAGGLLHNLFDYFDKFANYFSETPDKTDAYTQWPAPQFPAVYK